MQIDWWTFGLQIINFLVLVWLLQRFLYKPVQDVIEARRQRAREEREKAETLMRDAQALKQKFEAALNKIERDRQNMLDEAHKEIARDRERMENDAKTQSEHLHTEARQTILKERDQALKDLKEEIATLAAGLAEKLLREAGVETNQSYFLGKVEQKLSEMDPAERERINDELATNGAGMTIISAYPLKAKERGLWQKRLSKNLALDVPIKFESDENFLGGMEVRFPHTVLKFTWSDQLAELKEVLLDDVHSGS